MIDVAAVAAIDVHVHTERSRAGHDPLPPELRDAAARYFKSDEPLPTVDDVADYYRARGLAAVLFTVDWEARSGRPPSRTRRSPTPRAPTRTSSSRSRASIPAGPTRSSGRAG